MSERKLKKLEKEYLEQLAQLEDPVKRLEVGSMYHTTLKTYCQIIPPSRTKLWYNTRVHGDVILLLE